MALRADGSAFCSRFTGRLLWRHAYQGLRPEHAARRARDGIPGLRPRTAVRHRRFVQSLEDPGASRLRSFRSAHRRRIRSGSEPSRRPPRGTGVPCSRAIGHDARIAEMHLRAIHPRRVRHNGSARLNRTLSPAKPAGWQQYLTEVSGNSRTTRYSEVGSRR